VRATLDRLIFCNGGGSVSRPPGHSIEWKGTIYNADVESTDICY